VGKSKICPQTTDVMIFPLRGGRSQPLANQRFALSLIGMMHSYGAEIYC